MISDKAMLICLHITMWSARKFDKRVSEEVAQSHEANTNAGRYNKHLLDQAEKLEELRALAQRSVGTDRNCHRTRPAHHRQLHCEGEALP